MPARFSASVTLMFQEVPFLERFARASAAGFDGVEVQDMRAASVNDIGRAARDAGTAIALINADVGDAADGGPGLSGVPGREQDFDRAIAAAIEAADILAASTVHIGPSRRVAGVSDDECMATYLRNVEQALRRAEGSGRRLAIEALNRLDAPDVLIGELDVAASIVRRFSPHLGLLFDAYHVARGGLDPADAYRSCADTVSHVQVADAPGRNDPGAGVIDFESFFGALAANAYSGWIGAEYRPLGAISAQPGWLTSARSKMAGNPDA